MRFEWDDAKNRRNLVKHKVSFETARMVFEDAYALSVQDRFVDDEERWQTLGQVPGSLVVLVAHTYSEAQGEEVIRIVSARKATSTERKAYEEASQKKR